MRILLTGHAGLVGTAARRLLTASGAEVRGFDLDDGGSGGPGGLGGRARRAG